jgi:hypothetical protein
MSRRTGWALGAVVVVAAVVFVPPVRAAWLGFFDALRIARPQSVSVNIPSFTGPTANRQLENIVGSMVAETASVTLDEPEQAASGAGAAGRLAGFAPQLPRARTDAPRLTVVGAHAVTMTVKLSQLTTILTEAGVPRRDLPRDLEGATVRVRTPRAIRAEYGHCPQPAPQTLQSQLQGPPPPSADNSDCVILTEGPATTVDAPAGLDLEQLVGIALELSGMSPVQARAFRTTLDWKALLGLAIPRFVRSYQSADLGGAPAVLLGTAFRRGPTYVLIWTRAGMAYSLAGYGSAGDAVPLAASIAPGARP